MSLTVTSKVRFARAAKGKVEMRTAMKLVAPAPTGRVPRISRLMALAIRFDGLLRRGEVKDYAELARLGHVTRARVTQIMNLLNLTPDIQEALLFLPTVDAGRDPVKEWQVRPLAAEPAWERQRRMWRQLPMAVATRCGRGTTVSAASPHCNPGTAGTAG
jgi:hypothetical protein